ncbi:hypothetical protein FB451DRAFT_1471027 [Mycena latifolia]|nr:hypothetical protein FB451DRAFT_1471027 [Mycena latifolia]
MPSIVTAALTEALLELFFYGVYAVLFTTVFYLFSRRGTSPKKRPPRWVLLRVGLVAQFLVITTHWVNTIYETYFAIVHLGGGAEAAAFYSDLSTPSSVIVIALLLICALVTDSLVAALNNAIFGSRLLTHFIDPPALLAKAGASLEHLSSAQLLNVVQFAEAASFISLQSGIPTRIPPYRADGWLAPLFYPLCMIVWTIWRINIASPKLLDRIGEGMQPTARYVIVRTPPWLMLRRPYWPFSSRARPSRPTFHGGLIGWTVFEGISPAVYGISTTLIHARIGLGWAYESDKTARLDLNRR